MLPANSGIDSYDQTLLHSFNNRNVVPYIYIYSVVTSVPGQQQQSPQISSPFDKSRDSQSYPATYTPQQYPYQQNMTSAQSTPVTATNSIQMIQKSPQQTLQQGISNQVQPNSQMTQQSNEPILAPYIPTVKGAQTAGGQQYYVLPADEIQKMLQQNAQIIRKFIEDVHNGKLIDMAEYTGLHTSVYLLSQFTKSKGGSTQKASVPVSMYQNLIKKMKHVEIKARGQHFSVCCITYIISFSFYLPVYPSPFVY